MMQGKKTYIVCGLMALASIAAAFGYSIPGFPADPLWGQHLLEALSIAALRNGIANS